MSKSVEAVSAVVEKDVLAVKATSVNAVSSVSVVTVKAISMRPLPFGGLYRSPPEVLPAVFLAKCILLLKQTALPEFQ